MTGNRNTISLEAPRPRHGRLCRNALLSILSAAMIAGCAHGDLKPQSRISQASDISTSKLVKDDQVSRAAWPDDQWWKSLGDPQLNQLLSEALSNSPTLREAAARLRQAAAAQNLQEAQLMPHVDAQGSTTRELYSTDGVTPQPAAGTWQTVNQITLNLTYEIDLWGKNRAAVAAALDRTHAAEVDKAAARIALATSLVQAYVSLDEAYRLRDIESKMLQQNTTILELTNKRFSAEIDSQIDVKQALAAVPANRAAIAALNESIELDKNRIAALVGRGPERGSKLQRPALLMPSSFAVPSALPADLIGRRPDVVAQRWLVEAAGHDIKVADAQFYPNINLSAFTGFQALGFGSLLEDMSRITGVGPAISLPIFDAGRLRANLAAHDAAYDAAVERYNQTLIDAIRDVADQLTSIRWQKQRYDEQLDATQTADAAADLVMKRYQGGLATYIQVLISQRNSLTQQLALAQLETRGLSLRVNLTKALGGGYEPSLATTSTAESK